MRKTAGRSGKAKRRALELARVLLVHGELAPRLALQTILQAGGYWVDAAASPAEALAKLDERQYDLVLTDSGLRSRNAATDVLAYARVKDYHPATAVIRSCHPAPKMGSSTPPYEMSIHAEDLPVLLGKVADLIGLRASRRYLPLRTAV